MRLTALLGILTITGLCTLSLSHHPRHRQYHVVYDQMNWTDAQRYCRDRFTDLATIESLEDVSTLNDMVDVLSLGNREHGYGAWIGLYDDINSWRWSLADHQDHQFRRWSHTEPNNMGSGECCTRMFTDGTWNDDECVERFCAICSDDTEPTEKYILINESLTWAEAQARCRERHTDLASVRNQAENDMVRKIIEEEGSPCWIGLYRDSWKWSDGSSHTFRDWLTGEPNNARLHENCVSLVFGKGSKFEDWNCDMHVAFICHSIVPEVPVNKQVVRIKVTRGNSSLDLNSPAVKEAILEQLKQSLKNGSGEAADIKLRWVEQSDGKVFHKEAKKNRKKKRERKPVLTKLEL